MKYFLALDGGGTKTEGVLTDSRGRILAHARGNASNPNDVTLPVAVGILKELTRSLMAKAGLGRDDLPEISLFGGISGGINHGPALERELTASLEGIGCLGIRSDVHILLSAEIPEGDGACIICGTGSACFLRKGNELHRIGGWGYLLDSGGSGYDLGRDALEAALRDHDGRGQPTVLSELLAQKLGKPVWLSITEIYGEGKPYIAACAPLVFEAARQGDAVAEAILDRNAARLAEYIKAAWKRLDRPAAEELITVMGGSISVKQSPAWQKRICLALEALTAGESPVPLTLRIASAPPVLGAVYEAMKQTALTPDSAVRQAFLASYDPTP